MELDELKTDWRELDRRAEAGLAIDQQLFRGVKLIETRSSLRTLSALLAYELISGVLATLLLGSFLADHLHAPRFAVPAVVLHAVAVFTIVSAARQLVRIGRLDYAAPVTAIQRELAELRATRLRDIRRLLLLSPLLWTPLAIVAARGLFGLDVYREFGPLWIALNLGFGAAMIPLAVGIARRHADRLGRSRWLGRLADDLAGRSLAAANRHLGEIARFVEGR